MVDKTRLEHAYLFLRAREEHVHAETIEQLQRRLEEAEGTIDDIDSYLPKLYDRTLVERAAWAADAMASVRSRVRKGSPIYQDLDPDDANRPIMIIRVGKREAVTAIDTDANFDDLGRTVYETIKAAREDPEALADELDAYADQGGGKTAKLLRRAAATIRKLA